MFVQGPISGGGVRHDAIVRGHHESVEGLTAEAVARKRDPEIQAGHGITGMAFFGLSSTWSEERPEATSGAKPRPGRRAS